jgi:hypothetical protein
VEVRALPLQQYLIGFSLKINLLWFRNILSVSTGDPIHSKGVFLYCGVMKFLADMPSCLGGEDNRINFSVMPSARKTGVDHHNIAL